MKLNVCIPLIALATFATQSSAFAQDRGRAADDEPVSVYGEMLGKQLELAQFGMAAAESSYQTSCKPDERAKIAKTVGVAVVQDRLTRIDPALSRAFRERRVGELCILAYMQRESAKVSLQTALDQDKANHPEHVIMIRAVTRSPRKNISDADSNPKIAQPVESGSDRAQ